ncbi:tyrosine kinase receptor Cad96Ca [Glossina fuscipes]|uniref:receptor protein-tyrosine kinase n=1 Tax=Glossina fuscipes TaxID=7396 RepID=A0A9C5Z8R8_9MUSC|nr:tyrosine kinase receptor Cad96Ca [Glossina fuscipes]
MCVHMYRGYMYIYIMFDHYADKQSNGHSVVTYRSVHIYCTESIENILFAYRFVFVFVLLRYYVRAMHKCSCSPAGATVNGVSAGVRRQTLQSEGYGKYQSPPKLSLFMAVIAVGIAVVVFPIKPASCQEHTHLNTPPILIIPDRNWRIAENEPVGQIIARVRADDSESDELIFGLESQFKDNQLPFRIDPIGGVVYLNESLAGRSGENFFLYITVTDGQLTAKNEVYVNILSSSNNKNQKPRATPPSISNVVHNISHFLPAFGRLPGVQSVRNQFPNRRPSNILPPGFNVNGIYSPPVLNYNPSQQLPVWPTNNVVDNVDENVELTTAPVTSTTLKTSTTLTTSRTRLTPIKQNASTSSTSTIINENNKNSTLIDDGNSSSSIVKNFSNGAVELDDLAERMPTVLYGFKSQMIPVILVVSIVFVAAALIVGVLYRKRLCAFGKTFKKKSKEEMAKKSNQSNLSSSNLTDDSRNSMVMQHWHGPMAYGNRYVPWERDQAQQQQQFQLPHQSVATAQLSTSAANGGNTTVIQTDVTSCTLGISSNSLTAAVGGNISGNIVGGHCTQQQDNKYDRWEFPRHRLKVFNKLGEGAFGQVWRCEATDIDGHEGITMVAVKMLKENASEVEKKDLLSELEVMKSLEPHVNVVRFLGCCTDKDPIFVIIEYVNRGKLQTYLRNSRAERHYGNTHGKSNILTSGDLTSFMYQVAKGMDYLTSRGIIHRDLAARNILITDDHTCKVADFGFARDVITSKIYERKSEGRLPIRWMAIESLYDNIFSTESDIWSFGILMWEIVTLGSTPYPGISAAEVMRKVRDGYRLEKPEHCRRELYNIMFYCWAENRHERPTFGEIVQMLDKLLHTEMDYVELERFPDHNYYNIVNVSGEKV